MKKDNIKLKILELIKEENGISRIEISRRFGITPASVGKIIGEFLDSGTIIEEREGESTGGRKPLILNINKKDWRNFRNLFCSYFRSNKYWRYRWRNFFK